VAPGPSSCGETVSVLARWTRVADPRAASQRSGGLEEIIMTSPKEEGSTATERPAGTVDEDANPPLSAPGEFEPDAAGGDRPPQDTGQAVPPYEGRQTSAKE
jgi:hypothetical protein